MRLLRPAGAFFIGLIAVFGLMGQPAAQTISERLAEIEQDVTSLSQRLAHLNTTYVDSSQVTPAFQMERRLADGRLLYLLGDYVRASIVFLDIVENASDPDAMAVRNARYFLAESLFESHNLVPARGYFREVANDRSHEHREDALRRLLEISFMTRDFTDVEDLYDELRRSGSATARSDIAYVLAKTLYFQEHYEQAAAGFEVIGADNDEYLRAQYFLGVCYVQLRQWDEAITAFQRVVDSGTDSEYERSAELVDLAYLAVGRIHYELEQPEDALSAYVRVSRTSDSYDRALYELCWTYIKMERFNDALRTLEVLILAVPDSHFLPRAQLLRGDLLLRMANYGEALVIFDSTVQTFGPLVDQLATTVADNTDPEGLFEALIDSSNASLRLPEIAREWVEDDEAMRRALDLLSDLEVQAGEIRESREIIEDIQAVLDSASRVDVFPQVRSGYGQALEIENTIPLVRVRLLELEAQMLLPTASDGNRRTYDAARSERERFLLDFRGFPLTYGEMTTQEELVESDIRDLEMDIYRLGYDIESQRSQLAAIEQQLMDDEAGGIRSESQTQQLQQELAQFEAELEELETARDNLRRELERERLQTGLTTVTPGTDGVHAQLSEAIDAERDVLNLMRAATPSEFVSSVAELDRFHGQLDTLANEVEAFYVAIDALIEQQATEIRHQIQMEDALLTEYDSMLADYGGRGERLAGEIVFENFIVVQNQFNELILTADVGIIDIAWRQKEDRSARIGLLLDQRNDQLSNFDAEFREVLDSN